MNDDTEARALRTLVEELMREEHCSEKAALKIVVPVMSYLRLDDAGALLDRLRDIEAQLGKSGLRVSRVRLVSLLYLCGAVSMTPAGNAAFATIVRNAATLPTPTERRH